MRVLRPFVQRASTCTSRKAFLSTTRQVSNNTDKDANVDTDKCVSVDVDSGISTNADAVTASDTSDAGDTAGTDKKVVEPTPVYSKEEAAAIEPSSKKPNVRRVGARSSILNERDPVVVHALKYPIHNGKWYRIVPDSASFTQIGKSHMHRVPTLAHGLERVLFSPGVHCLQDPNSKVYNFDPYIRNITQPADFDFDKLTPYITSSMDKTLMEYARTSKKRFVGSTSSMTHVLSHLYFAISGGKQPDVSCLSMKFADMPNRFTRGMRYPASIALRYHDGVYGIDADKSFDVKDSILSILGKSLEKLLTSSPKEFEKYKKENSWKVKNIPEETYHYATFGDFALRSQLDCRDPRLPRKSFDLKTRGSLAVRMDLENYEVSKGYQINTMKGRLQSFEREYYDMARSAFLKYNFQTRIGNMDGIFVAYHNTARMFGFQYISRREMDEVLFGNEATGNTAFKVILILLGNMLRTVTDQYPNMDLRVTFNSHGASGNLDMWVEVINDEEEAIAAQQYQNTGQFTTSTPPNKAEPTSSPEGNEGADPFSTPDPLNANSPTASNNADPENEHLEEDIDPADDIYINTEHPIIHYTLETFSTFNDQDTNEPVTVRSGNDEWCVNFALKKSLDSPEALAQQYRNLRLRQSTYFERASPDTPDEELYPLVRILRKISRREMWKNKLPTGKFVVNRSRPPIYDSDNLKIREGGSANQDIVKKTKTEIKPRSKNQGRANRRQPSDQ
ncbi:hypothetical protein H4R24_000788 [Coemansia sp. RSA 988]|nr:hypothetical protein H4R24_000788 [Coemansia sp. RSA 988]